MASQNARHKHTYPFFSNSKMSSWPSAFILTSALKGCCMQKRWYLLLIPHHHYEHIQKHLKPLLTAGKGFNLQTWSAREGKGQAVVAPSTRHTAASPRHSRAGAGPGSSTGVLVGCRTWASDPRVSGGRMEAQTWQQVLMLEHLDIQLGGRGALHPLPLYAMLRTTSQDIPTCPRGLQVKYMS